MANQPKIIVHAVVVLCLLLAGLLGFQLLQSSRQALGRHQAKTPLPLVRVVPVRTGPIDITISGEGTVQTRTESQLVPQVSGEVVKVSPHLVNGGSFKKGERLLTIDPRDYEIALTLAEASVKDAESRYKLAAQESQASRQEWEKIHAEREPPPLVAKAPQLSAAKAHLAAQQANLEKARLNLQRTRIYAPFTGRVTKEQVDIGQYVTPGQMLATIYATDVVEIIVPLENDDLEWLDVPDFTTDSPEGSKANVQARVAGRKMTWPGRIDRVQGKIDPQTRLVQVVICVPEPFITQPPLVPGQFVKVKLAGRSLKTGAVIPRAALRGQNTVWAVNPEENLMYFRTVEIAHRDERGIIVHSGLKKDDLAVVSPLKTATDGMRVKPVQSETGEVS